MTGPKPHLARSLQRKREPAQSGGGHFTHHGEPVVSDAAIDRVRRAQGRR